MRMVTLMIQVNYLVIHYVTLIKSRKSEEQSCHSRIILWCPEMLITWGWGLKFLKRPIIEYHQAIQTLLILMMLKIRKLQRSHRPTASKIVRFLVFLATISIGLLLIIRKIVNQEQIVWHFQTDWNKSKKSKTRQIWAKDQRVNLEDANLFSKATNPNVAK